MERETVPESGQATDAPAAPRRGAWWRALGWLAVGVGVLVLIGAGLVFATYRAATAAMPEYDALVVAYAEQEATGELDRHCQELESRVAALYSDSQKQPRWQAVLTADQLNGWLARQLEIDFPELERRGVREPVVMLAEGAATLAFGVTLRGVDAVAALTVQPFVAEDGSLGFEVVDVRVGRLPLPAPAIIERVNEALAAAGHSQDDLAIRWTEIGGRPVLLIDFERLASTPEESRRLDTIQVRDGELYVAGATESEALPPGEPAAPSPTSDAG